MELLQAPVLRKLIHDIQSLSESDQEKRLGDFFDFYFEIFLIAEESMPLFLINVASMDLGTSKKIVLEVLDSLVVHASHRDLLDVARRNADTY